MSAKKEAGEAAGRILGGAFKFLSRGIKEAVTPSARATGREGAKVLRRGGRAGIENIRNILRTAPEESARLRESIAKLQIRPGDVRARGTKGSGISGMVGDEATAAWRKDIDELRRLEELTSTPQAVALRRLESTPDEQLSFAERRLKSKLATEKPLNVSERYSKMMGEIAAKPIRKPLGLSLKYVAAPLGAAAIGARTVGAFREEGPAPLDLTAISQGAEAEAPTTDRFADTLAELEAIMSAGEGKYASEAKANLADYLANMNQYVASQAPAVRGAYDQLAAEAQREAAMAYARGQGAAGDVYGMYQDVAGQTAGYGAGEGLATGAGELAGLTGVSGEMATAPQELGAYGASLADYLGRSAGITRDDLAAAARSYQAAGIGSEAEMRNMAAGLAAQREYELGQNIAEYNEARRQELADLKSQLAVERMAYEQGLEVPTTKEQRDARRVQAERIWRDLDEDQQKAVLDLYITKEDYLAAFLRDPDSVSATVTGLTED